LINKIINFIFLEYSLQNVCQPQDTTLSYGFLSTPNYPHGFSPNLNCPCALFAPPGHAIVLEVIDFRLPTCAEAGLILWLGQDFQTKCLTQDPLTVVSNIQQNVTLRFYTLAHAKHGGFLIKYSVLPVTNNATIRLQCYVAPAVSRPPASTNFPTPNLSQQPPLQIPGMPDGMDMMIDPQGDVPIPPLIVTHPNDLTKLLPSDQNDAPPILGTLEEHKVCEKISRDEVFVFLFFRRLCHYLGLINNSSSNYMVLINRFINDVKKKRIISMILNSFVMFFSKFRFISKFNISSSFKYDINRHLCCCCCYFSSDHDQCSHMVHFFVAVSTNWFVLPSTQHATASSIVLYYMSCIYVYIMYIDRAVPNRLHLFKICILIKRL
jgi:hypothetical protein